MHLVLGLGRGQHLVQIARPGQVSVLDRGVRQKFADFVDVCALAGFVQQQQQLVQGARIVAHMGDHGMQTAQQLGRIRRQQAIGMTSVNVECLVILAESRATLRLQKQPLGIVVHGEQFLGNRGSLGQVPNLQVRLQEVAQPFGMRIEVGRLLQVLDGVLRIVALDCGLPAQQQNVTVARIEGQHPLQNVFGGGQVTPRAQRFRRRAENLPRFFFLSQPDIDLGQLHPHGHIFRVHFEDLLEKPHRLFQVAILHEVFGDLQVLGASVVEQALLGIELRQFQRCIHAGLQLGDLLVHGDALDREALRGIGIAHGFEALDGFGRVAQARVKIADGVVDGKILGIVLQDLVVLSNGVLQLALLDKLLRGAENLLFVKAKTKRHRGTDSSLFPVERPRFSASVTERARTSPGDSQTKPRKPGKPGSRRKVIVRPGTRRPMVTDDYWGLPKGSVRPVPEKMGSRRPEWEQRRS